MKSTDFTRRRNSSPGGVLDEAQPEPQENPNLSPQARRKCGDGDCHPARSVGVGRGFEIPTNLCVVRVLIPDPFTCK